MKSIAECRDCMEAMKEFPDKFFDLAVVDPPYGIGMDGGQIGGSVKAVNHVFARKEWDRSPPPDNYFEELRRVSRNQVIFGANHFMSRLGALDASCWIVWDKENGENSFADCELAWTSFGGAVRKFAFRWQGMLQGNMATKEERIHPTQKPVALYSWLLGKYAKPGDKILDTHLGSGSSRIAAYDLGLDFWGYEIDREYFDLQEERFVRHAAQRSLFDPPEEDQGEQMSL